MYKINRKNKYKLTVSSVNFIILLVDNFKYIINCSFFVNLHKTRLQYNMGFKSETKMQLITIYLLLASKTKGKLLNITQEQCFSLSKAENKLILK